MSARKIVTKSIIDDFSTYVGRDGELFYDITANSLKISDGITPGGVTVLTDGTGTGGTYVLPTASTSILGGVKVDGTSITIDAGVIKATTATFSQLVISSPSVTSSTPSTGSYVSGAPILNTSLYNYFTVTSTAGADAVVNLTSGSYNGQRVTVFHGANSGDAVFIGINSSTSYSQLAVTNLGGVQTKVREYLWNGSNWFMIASA